MKRLFQLIGAGLMLLAGATHLGATVSIEFQFGPVNPGIFGPGSLGVLVADVDGNGFLSPVNAAGTTLSVGQTMGGSDDVIAAVFPVGTLADWNQGRGFAAVLEPIDYDALGVSEGHPLIFYAFPNLSAGETIPSGPDFGQYRTDHGSFLSGDMGFALPADGGAYRLAVFDDQQGGQADLAAFGNGPPHIVVESPAGTTVPDGGTLEFGNQSVGYAAVRTVRIVNPGGAELTDLAVSEPPGPQSDFTVGPLSGTEVLPGDDLTFQITFAPAFEGEYDLTLEIASNAPDSNPFVLALHGTAVPDPRLAKPVETPVGGASGPSSTPVGSWDDETLSGIYDGLLRDAGDNSLSGCISRLVVTRQPTGASGGAVSGVIRMNGRSARLRGSFDATGLLDVDLPQLDGSTVEVNLQLELTDDIFAEVIRGTIIWNGATADADLALAPYNARTTPAPEALTGSYTMLMPSGVGWGTDEPGGDGWATARISAGGGITIAGLLGDGTRFTEAAFLFADNAFVLHADLYRSNPKGRIGGRVVCRDQSGISDFDGLLQWRKFADAREARYAEGFDVEVWALGSEFEVVENGQRILDVADEHHNAELSLIGPTAPLVSAPAGSLDRVLSWLANNRIVHYGPERLAASANRGTGRIGGSFFDPVTRTRVGFTAVAFQKQDIAGGLFIHQGKSGTVRILPGTGFTYPGSEAAGVLARIGTASSPATPPIVAGSDDLAGGTGVYQGILTDGSGDATGALEGLKLTAAGALSGTVWIDGARQGFRGTVESDGTAIIVLPAGTLTLHLALAATTEDGFQFTGDLALIGGGSLAVDAQRRPVFTRSNRCPEEGRYTVAMRAPNDAVSSEEPGGDGYGMMVVGYPGTCTGAFYLADGAKATLAGHVSRNSEWSFHRGLYGRVPQGYLAGKLTFRDVQDISDVDGEWHWVKLPGAAVYPLGFDTSRGTVGCRYTPPLRGERAFPGLDDATFNIWARFANSGLGDIDEAATWTTSNSILHYGPERFLAGFNPRTGLTSGSYLDATNPPNRISATFGGALLQKQGLVTGRHISGTEYGLFVIQPRTQD